MSRWINPSLVTLKYVATSDRIDIEDYFLRFKGGGKTSFGWLITSTSTMTTNRLTLHLLTVFT